MSDRRTRRIKPSDWRIAVDDECDPLSQTSHIMTLCEHPECGCDPELEMRHPLCGQVFREGWMQIEAAGNILSTTRPCLRCLKIALRRKINRRVVVERRIRNVMVDPDERVAKDDRRQA